MARSMFSILWQLSSVVPVLILITAAFTETLTPTSEPIGTQPSSFTELSKASTDSPSNDLPESKASSDHLASPTPLADSITVDFWTTSTEGSTSPNDSSEDNLDSSKPATSTNNPFLHSAILGNEAVQPKRLDGTSSGRYSSSMTKTISTVMENEEKGDDDATEWTESDPPDSSTLVTATVRTDPATPTTSSLTTTWVDKMTTERGIVSSTEATFTTWTSSTTTKEESTTLTITGDTTSPFDDVQPTGSGPGLTTKVKSSSTDTDTSVMSQTKTTTSVAIAETIKSPLVPCETNNTDVSHCLDKYNYVDTTVVGEGTGNVTNKTLTERANYGLRIFAGIFTIILIIASVIGNTITIYVSHRSPRLKTVASAFIIRYLQTNSIDVTTLPALCILVPLVHYYCVGASLFSLGLISVNRFVMVGFLSTYQKIYTPRNSAYMIGGLWFGLLISFIPTLSQVWGKFDYDQKMHYCSIVRDENGNTSKYAVVSLGFALPCAAIIISYTGIFVVVHRAETKMRNHYRYSAAPSSSTEDLDIRHSSRFSPAEAKITKMILVVFVSFLLCYLPNTIIKVADKDAKYANFQVLSYLLLYMSSCVNPIIYAVTNPQYRNAYADLAYSLRHSFQPNDYDFRPRRKTQMTTVV